MIRRRSNWIPPNRSRSDEYCVGDVKQLRRDGAFPTLLLRSELQVLRSEPGTVDGLDDDAWNKSHRSGLDEQKVSLSVLEELDEPELSRDLDGLHHHQQSRPESRERRLVCATTRIHTPIPEYSGLGKVERSKTGRPLAVPLVHPSSRQ